jgi:hypothetical protein
MERLAQDHLNLLLHHPRLTCPGQKWNPSLRGGRRALKQGAIRTAFYSFSQYRQIYFFLSHALPYEFTLLSFHFSGEKLVQFFV